MLFALSLKGQLKLTLHPGAPGLIPEFRNGLCYPRFVSFDVFLVLPLYLSFTRKSFITCILCFFSVENIQTYNIARFLLKEFVLGMSLLPYIWYLHHSETIADFMSIKGEGLDQTFDSKSL